MIQQYAVEILIAKGLLGLLATLLLLYHMSHTWERVLANGTLGQQLRYYSLLAFSVLVATSTVEQLKTDTEIGYRHLGSILAMILLVVAMAISIKEDRKPVAGRTRHTGSDGKDIT